MENTLSHTAESSRDPGIAGSTDSMIYKLSGEGSTVWKESQNRFEQKLELSYGQMKSQHSDGWEENTDNIFYTATYERTLSAPRFIYGNATGETVFTGKAPAHKPFDPTIGKLSTGYGHRYEGLLPEKDALVGRVGVYVRKRQDTLLPDTHTDVETGPEIYARYERRQNADVSYFAQIEGYAEFRDPQHVTQQAQAGLTVKVAKLLTVEFKVQAYYESLPTGSADGTPGYDEWSLRQEALIGLSWRTGSR